MKRLRVAVIGVGHLGRHHARILGAMPGVELVAVADSRPEQARSVASACGTEPVADWRALLGRVDAVSVAVPTRSHREVAGAFLERGIPALVEKPLALNAAQAEELCDLARHAGAPLQVGHIERYNPALAALDGLNLRPRFVSAERLAVFSFRSTDIGVVLDLMIHDLDLILSMIPSAVRSVSAVGVSLFGGHEDVASARLEFDCGAVAELTASRASERAVRSLRIWGSDCYAGLDLAAKKARIVRPTDRLRHGDLGVETLDLSRPDAIKAHVFGELLDARTIEPPPGPEPLALELEDFVQAARTGRRPRVSGEDALRAVRVAEQIVRSLRNHRWDGPTTVPTGPHAGATAADPARPIAGLAGPKRWKVRTSPRADAPKPG